MAEGRSVLCLVESRQGFSRVVLLGKMSVAWLKTKVEALIRMAKVRVSQIASGWEQGLHCLERFYQVRLVSRGGRVCSGWF